MAYVAFRTFVSAHLGIIPEPMNSQHDKGRPGLDRESGPTGDNDGTSHSQAGPKPQWTNGLRQLYDKVVDEPIPSSFIDLLDQLDGKN